MKCANCGVDLREGQKFCHICGQAVNKTCPNCGETIEGTEKFCTFCGYSLSAQDTAPASAPAAAPIDTPTTDDVPDVKYPPEEALAKLMEMNREVKAAIIATIGTRFLNKWLGPMLRDSEKLITIDNIQSKWLFARYRRECVVLTDQRVIKLEKLQYFKPKIEECELAGIRDIEVDEPANAVSATVIGEKIKIISSSGIMNMRMVGKGAAKQLAAQIRNAQNEPGVCVDRPGSPVDNRPKKKGREKNRIILGVAVFTLLVAVWIAKMVLVDGGTLQIGGLLIGPQADQIEAMEIYGKVSGGYLGDYGMVTVGEVFQETLPDGKWDGFITDQDQIIAQYVTQDQRNKIQFMVSEHEGGFHVVHMVFKGETLQEASDCKIALDSLYGEYFKNHPELGQTENPSWDNITTEGHFLAPAVAVKESQAGEEEFDRDISSLQAASGEEVAAFLKEAGIPEEMEGYLYGDDDIVISLDGDGRVETVSILSGQYSWYGMKVGEVFLAEQAEKTFEMYGYGFVLSDENQYFYAVNSGQAQSADGAVRIKLYDDQRIMEIDYIAEGAEEAWNSLAENSGNISAETTPAYEPYILPDSDRRYLSGEELVYMDKAALRLARNEIYARHGRQFESEDLNEYFNSQPWYDGSIAADGFDDSVLNEYEKANLDLIKRMEDGTSVYGLPDYIVGGVGQLGEADIINCLYMSANGTTMEIGEYSGTGETYVNFFQNDEMVWSGVVNRYQTLDDGGLVLMFEGENVRTGESDYLEVEWSTMKLKDTPVVVHEADTISIVGVYTFSYPLFGN